LQTTSSNWLENLMFRSMDQFIRVAFGDSVHRFTYRDLLIPTVTGDSSLQWQRVADLYCATESYLRAGCKKKFVTSRDKAHLELRFLVRSTSPWVSQLLKSGRVKDQSTLQRLERLKAPLSMEAQRVRHLVFLVRFWRICHKLLKLDLAWPEHEYSFVTDFLLELQWMVRNTYSEHHSFCKFLIALCQVSKVDMQEMLSEGASQTVQVIGSAVQAKMAIILRFWTNFLYMQQGQDETESTIAWCSRRPGSLTYQVSTYCHGTVLAVVV
jgi:hypothetical protein